MGEETVRSQTDGSQDVLAPAGRGVRDGCEEVAELDDGGDQPGLVGAQLCLALEERILSNLLVWFGAAFLLNPLFETSVSA